MVLDSFATIYIGPPPTALWSRYKGTTIIAITQANCDFIPILFEMLKWAFAEPQSRPEFLGNKLVASQ